MLNNGFGKFARTVCLFAITIMVAGCAETLEGTYADPSADLSLKFEKNGKVLVHSFRTDYPTVYKYSGKTIKVQITLTNTEFTVNDDGSLSGPAGMHLIKVR